MQRAAPHRLPAQVLLRVPQGRRLLRLLQLRLLRLLL